jgi:hypothetical protein
MQSGGFIGHRNDHETQGVYTNLLFFRVCLNLDVGWKSKLFSVRWASFVLFAFMLPSNYFQEHLDVPAAEYLNSLDIQGRLFSNFREKELVIFVANDAPNQSVSNMCSLYIIVLKIHSLFSELRLVWKCTASGSPPAGIIRS